MSLSFNLCSDPVPHNCVDDIFLFIEQKVRQRIPGKYLDAKGREHSMNDLTRQGALGLHGERYYVNKELTVASNRANTENSCSYFSTIMS